MSLATSTAEVVYRDPAPGPTSRLQRVLCAIALDPSKKFGSMEEQLFVQAQAFRDQGSVFYPLFLCPPTPGALRVYEEAGLPAACLDLRRFSVIRAWQMARL